MEDHARNAFTQPLILARLNRIRLELADWRELLVQLALALVGVVVAKVAFPASEVTSSPLFSMAMLGVAAAEGVRLLLRSQGLVAVALAWPVLVAVL